jgi:hypothetical protein
MPGREFAEDCFGLVQFLDEGPYRRLTQVPWLNLQDARDRGLTRGRTPSLGPKPLDERLEGGADPAPCEEREWSVGRGVPGPSSLHQPDDGLTIEVIAIHGQVLDPGTGIVVSKPKVTGD